MCGSVTGPLRSLRTATKRSNSAGMSAQSNE